MRVYTGQRVAPYSTVSWDTADKQDAGTPGLMFGRYLDLPGVCRGIAIIPDARDVWEPLYDALYPVSGLDHGVAIWDPTSRSRPGQRVDRELRKLVDQAKSEKNASPLFPTGSRNVVPF